MSVPVSINVTIGNSAAIVVSLSSAVVPQSMQTVLIGKTIDVAYAPVIVTNSGSANQFRVILNGNALLQNPINAVDGQKIMWEIVNTGAYTLSYDTQFSFSSDLPSAPVSGIAGKHDYVGAVYNAETNKWNIIAFLRGY